MFGWLKSLFLDDPARAAPAKGKPRAAAGQTRVAAQTRAPARPAMTPERAELLRQAAEVHRAKRKILDHLSDEDRAKLVATAITAFLHEAEGLAADRPAPKPNTKKK